MLRKHFRGYQELISFSSRHFYDNSLQSIKIRSKPVSEIIRFKILENVQDCAVRDANRAEAEFIRDELRRMLGAERKLSVGVITPFREQLKLLNDLLFRDPLADQFKSALKLRVMTFDTCQGEERDLIIFSMVAIPTRDVLNYIFPPKLDGVADQAEEKLKVQRLNVGFSRAKEGFLFVLSKPVEDFRGAIGRVLLHYKSVLEDRSKPDVSQVDPSSPMEAKVLDWIKKTSFYQANDQAIELIPQFPIGRPCASSTRITPIRPIDATSCCATRQKVGRSMSSSNMTASPSISWNTKKSTTAIANAITGGRVERQ